MYISEENETYQTLLAIWQKDSGDVDMVKALLKKILLDTKAGDSNKDE